MPGYDTARGGVWHANVPERFPAAIVRAGSVNDVIAAVRFAGQQGLRVAIRGGGHNWSASSLREGSLMIDLGGLNAMQVDPESRTARIQPGVSGGALVAEALKHGLIFPVAHCPSVPMSGFLLNGGYGFNAGQWGPSALLIDEMQIVTADGELVTATATENPELFWSARGSGPSFFGVVVGFVVRLQPNPRAILATNYIFPLAATSQATAALQAIRSDCPDNVELTFLASAGAGPPAMPAIGIVSGIAFADDVASAERSLKFMDNFAAADAAIVKEQRVPLEWSGLFEMVAGLFPAKMHYLGNTIWTDARVDDLYVPYADHLAAAPNRHAFSNCVLYPPGFAERAKTYEAALSLQGDTLSLQYAIWNDPAEAATNEKWFRRSIDLFQRHAHGHYIGETDLNLYPQFAKGAYAQEAWARLSSLRRKFDPDGRFHDFLGTDGERA
jgi:FAD/FMN-containing dehydrogenase